jgi:hypothetical protein
MLLTRRRPTTPGLDSNASQRHQHDARQLLDAKNGQFGRLERKGRKLQPNMGQAFLVGQAAPAGLWLSRNLKGARISRQEHAPTIKQEICMKRVQILRAQVR